MTGGKQSQLLVLGLRLEFDKNNSKNDSDVLMIMVMELWSKINFLRINVKLKVIQTIVDIFVGNLSSYNCRNLFSLDRHLYEEISSNNCHSTNWGDTGLTWQ